MSSFTLFRNVFLCFFVCLSPFLKAQNISLSTVPPNKIYVCGVKEMSVKVQNLAGSPVATNLTVSVVFPIGIEYVPGSLNGTGVTELNITNLSAPVFKFPDLNGGETVDLMLTATGTCAGVDQINAGLPFSYTINANYAGGLKQLTSPEFEYNVGLANIISVVPNVAQGVKGDMILRTIKIKNTRPGAIHSLSIRDQHQGGITISIQGAINQNNAPTLYTAEIPSSYFTAFGDGDDIFEEDEEITVVEKVTIESCGAPSFTTKSDIIVGWGCNGQTCRTETIAAQITILPSLSNPLLRFEEKYARPLSYCGKEGSTQEILIRNTGPLPATNVLMDIFTVDTTFMGLDSASFEWSFDRVVWQHPNILAAEPTILLSCNITDYMLSMKPVVPLVPAGDTVYVRYNSYFCQPTCLGLYPAMRFGYVYSKACPPDQSVSGLQNFFPDTAFLKVESQVNFDIKYCLEDDSTYKEIVYWLKSRRLPVDTGVVQIIIELPKGLEWDVNCPFILDNKTPMEFGTMTDANGTTTIRAVFDLPFSTDSVGSEICIKYVCQPDLPCAPAIANVPPRGQSFTAYPPPSDCKGCELQIKAFSIISQHADDTPDCGITACDEFSMVVDDVCNGGNGGGGGGIASGGGGGGGGSLEYTVAFDSYRINLGLEDNDGDRTATSNNPANSPNIRIDRFITGDTLRNELKIKVTSGNLEEVNYRLFLESLSSDFGKLDGDAYDMVLSNPAGLFANYDTTKFVQGKIIIKKANGQTFSCDLSVPTIRSDQHLIPVAEPNTRPPAIIDLMVSMFDQYDFKLSDYIQNGCLSAGFEITDGDEITFQSDYKFTNNFVPLGDAEPPLINFKSSVCDVTKIYSWELENFCSERPIRQYSGYLEFFTPPVQTISPCDVSAEERPFSYEIRIAREDMFPFEIRPLSSVTSYTYGLPSNVALLNTKLNYLQLQEADVRFSNVSLTPQNNGNSINLDLDQFFNKPLDEGYSFEISTQFDTTCGYNGTKFGRVAIGLDYPNMCFHNPISDVHVEENENGYLTGSPELVLSNIGPDVVSINTADLELNFTIRNNSPVQAFNSWIIIDSDNNLQDVELFLLDPPNLIPVPNIGGVFQLGTLDPFAQPFFKLVAKSRSCGPYTVTYRFGWSCAPTYNGQANACGEFTGTVEIRPEESELDLGISASEPSSVPLCLPSADFEFVVTNADDGTAYNVDPTVKLPPGFRIEPGTSRLTYPAVGGVTKLMNDPQLLAGNIWLFDPESAPAPNPLINNGLPFDPQGIMNKMRITFRVRAECGAVANAKFIYGTEATQPCGISSNRVRKPGGPIGINGVNTANMAEPFLSYTDPNISTSCSSIIDLTATISLNGTPSTNDSIYVTLPVGTSYVAGSYTPGPNAPAAGAGVPLIKGQQLLWAFPANLPANAVLNFTFKIKYDEPASCFDQYISIQTREKTQAFCGTTQCDVFVATGEHLLRLSAQNPDLQLTNFQLQTQASGQLGFTANLDNPGTAAANNPVVQIFHDVNGNGQIDAGDLKVAQVNYAGTLSAGATALISGNLTLPPSAFCDLIALIPAAENCACDDVVIPLDGNQVVTKGLSFCDVQSVSVGTDLVAGSTYTWQTLDGVTCTTADCNNATYVPRPGVSSGDLVTLVLIEKAGNCTIERRFNIQFGVPPTEIVNETVCAGSSVTLTAPDGGIQYQWTGTGITNVNQQNQIVTPTTSGDYTVVFTFNGGCMGTKTTSVQVLPAPKSSKTVLVCLGKPETIFEADALRPKLETDVPGVYSRDYIIPSGCDSISTVTVVVPETIYMEHRNVCEGDSTEFYGDFIKVNGMYCKNDLVSVFGCDSTHCVEVTVVPNPSVPAQDSVIVQANELIVLDGPSGFSSYDWTPTGDDIKCPTCEDPEVYPDSTTNFRLIVKDNNNCVDTVTYRVVTCDVIKLLDKMMPNAFTPNGDGANDLFRPAPGEGAEMVVSLQVYSRWGTIVYDGRGANAAWDGQINGKAATSDVYVYVIVVECNGFQEKRNGQVTLLR